MRPHVLLVSSALLLLSTAAVSVPTAYQEFLDTIRAKPNLDRGAQYFATCSGCHGAQGEGKANGQVPRIAGQHFRVVARQLVSFRHGERWDMFMENFADKHRLPDAQAIADVAAYVSSLETTLGAGTGSGELVTHGASVYFRLCESCHGPSGQGDPNYTVPRIGGQHYEYLMRQIHDAVDGRRPGFPASHVRLLARLDHDDIVGVADYLSRIAIKPADPRALPAAKH